MRPLLISCNVNYQKWYKDNMSLKKRLMAKSGPMRATIRLSLRRKYQWCQRYLYRLFLFFLSGWTVASSFFFSACCLNNCSSWAQRLSICFCTNAAISFSAVSSSLFRWDFPKLFSQHLNLSCDFGYFWCSFRGGVVWNNGWGISWIVTDIDFSF